MTWEQKFQAMNALGEAALKMRHPGDWYVSQLSVEKSNGYVLCGNGLSEDGPIAAVEKHWSWLTEYKSDESIVVNSMRDTRREYRWNGFMWAVFERKVQP